MFVALDDDGNQRLAWHLVGTIPTPEMRCPECEEGVFLKAGAIKVPHFSHYPGSTCSFGSGEGARHLLLKSHVFKAFEAFDGVDYERSVIQGRRADLAIPAHCLAVEAQVSPMHQDEWLSRTAAYSDKDWHVLWVWDRDRVGGLESLAYIPREIRLCHRASYGHLTAVTDEGEFYAVNLQPHPYRRGGWRRVLYKHLVDDVYLNHMENDGLKLVSLQRGAWWKAWVS